MQAQDRFFEMDVRRHITAGRLSEMFGEDTLETDKVVRTLGWRRVAEQELRAAEPGGASPTSRRSAPGSTPTSRQLARTTSRWSTPCSALGGLDYEVEDWTPVDSVAWLKAMAWDLRGNMQDEIDRAMASTRLDRGSRSPSSTRRTPTSGTARRRRRAVVGRRRSDAGSGGDPARRRGAAGPRSSRRCWPACDARSTRCPTLVGTR